MAPLTPTTANTSYVLAGKEFITEELLATLYSNLVMFRYSLRTDSTARKVITSINPRTALVTIALV